MKRYILFIFSLILSILVLSCSNSSTPNLVPNETGNNNESNQRDEIIPNGNYACYKTARKQISTPLTWTDDDPKNSAKYNISVLDDFFIGKFSNVGVNTIELTFAENGKFIGYDYPSECFSWERDGEFFSIIYIPDTFPPSDYKNIYYYKPITK